MSCRAAMVWRRRELGKECMVSESDNREKFARNREIRNRDGTQGHT